MTLHKYLRICLLAAMIPSISVGQDKGLKRVEFEVDGSESVRFYPVGDRGVISLQRTDEINKNMRTWNVKLWDNDLKEKWSKNINMDRNQYMHVGQSEGNQFYFMTTSGPKKMLDVGFYDMNIDNGEYAFFNGNVPYCYLSESMVSNGKFYFTGATALTPQQKIMRMYASLCGCYIPLFFGILNDPTKPLIYNANFGSKSLNMLPSDVENKAFPLGITSNKYTDEITVIYKNYPKKKSDPTTMMLRRFDKNYKKLGDSELKMGEDRLPLNADITTIDAKTEMVIGSYNNWPKVSFFQKMKASRKNTGVGQANASAANGMYISKITNGSQDFIKFYDFKEFKAFYNSLSERSKKKLDKKKAKGKELDEGSVNYRLLFHNIEKVGDEYIVLAEAYYPEYHTEYRTTYVNGKATTQAVLVFDGYRYTHCIVSSFNEKGDLLWEDSFPIYEILTFVLKQRVRMLVSGKDIVIAYNYGGHLQSSVFRDGKRISTKTGSKIETGNESDKLKASGDSDLFYWYDNYFLATGSQVIKSELSKKERKEQNIDKKRSVYYMNKIAFE